MEYDEFLKQKQIKKLDNGFDIDINNINPLLFDYQKALVSWSLKMGRCAIFADTGLGKTFMQIEWAKHINQQTNKTVLIVSPLCVAEQTIEEAKKINVDIKYLRSYEDYPIIITNYEMLDSFKETIIKNKIGGIVLDESSILKHQDSKTRNKIIDLAFYIPYRLSCTATPSPNDFMELGSQSEFLGIMTQTEMLSTFFIHDSSNTSKWRLKGHGKSKFWEWLSTWAIYFKKPSDIGFVNSDFKLPNLNIEHIKIGIFSDIQETGLANRHKVKVQTLDERVNKTSEIVNNINSQVIVWCNRNDESKLLKQQIKDSVEVSGSDSLEVKKEKINKFTNNEIKVLITKPKIAGFGMNWQQCNNMVFVGLSDSYEQVYQAIRRIYRYGQKKEVNVYFIAHAREGHVLNNIMRKEKQSEEMTNQMVNFLKDFQYNNIRYNKNQKENYNELQHKDKNWTLYLGDCVELIKKLDDESVDYSIFSPPFASLYTYSNSDRDMGNNKSYDDFWIHFNYLIEHLNRVLKSGRNISVHCMNLPTSKVRDGYIGLRDFRGDIIRAFIKCGFIYHSEAVIWKDPVVAMQRTKALGLLWKQIKKDSSMCRQGLPDYILTFRKIGENKNPISHDANEFPVDKWQQYASPCWMDIRQSNVLNGKFAKQEDDEKHICPLQLDVIYRCLDLWSKKGDVVLSPFAGIGSEGFVSLQLNRKFIGFELKKSYYEVALNNLKIAENVPILDYTNKNERLQTFNVKKGNGDLNSFM